MNIAGILTGLGLGVALAYILDPDRGRRRRAMATDKAVSAAHTAADAVDTTSRDVRNRMRGRLAWLRSSFTSDDVDDHVLVERVRAKTGGVVGHSRSLDVSASGGHVTLRGPVLRREADRLVRVASRTRGVKAVDNQLEIHDSAADIPGLQGQPRRREGGPRSAFAQEVWSPTARLLGGLTGAALTLYGLRSGGAGGTVAGLTGTLLAARAATNLEVTRLLGLGRGRRGIVLRKTITIDAPIDEVFRLWSDYENFPRFMNHVRRVRRSSAGQAHWTVAGPGGVSIDFDTVETQRDPNRCIAWKTVEGATIAHAGIVRFDPDGGGTRVDLRMSYNPPGGALGHAVAALFGSDPKRAMDEDLVRLKSLLEDGRTRAHGDEVRRSELA